MNGTPNGVRGPRRPLLPPAGPLPRLRAPGLASVRGVAFLAVALGGCTGVARVDPRREPGAPPAFGPETPSAPPSTGPVPSVGSARSLEALPPATGVRAAPGAPPGFIPRVVSVTRYDASGRRIDGPEIPGGLAGVPVAPTSGSTAPGSPMAPIAVDPNAPTPAVEAGPFPSLDGALAEGGGHPLPMCGTLVDAVSVPALPMGGLETLTVPPIPLGVTEMPSPGELPPPPNPDPLPDPASPEGRVALAPTTEEPDVNRGDPDAAPAAPTLPPALPPTPAPSLPPPEGAPGDPDAVPAVPTAPPTPPPPTMPTAPGDPDAVPAPHLPVAPPSPTLPPPVEPTPPAAPDAPVMPPEAPVMPPEAPVMPPEAPPRPGTEIPKFAPPGDPPPVAPPEPAEPAAPGAPPEGVTPTGPGSPKAPPSPEAPGSPDATPTPAAPATPGEDFRFTPPRERRVLEHVKALKANPDDASLPCWPRDMVRTAPAATAFEKGDRPLLVVFYDDGARASRLAAADLWPVVLALEAKVDFVPIDLTPGAKRALTEDERRLFRKYYLGYVPTTVVLSPNRALRLLKSERVDPGLVRAAIEEAGGTR